MKSIIILVLAAFFTAVSLSGCKNSEESINNSEKLSIVTTVFAPYDFARSIAGDNAELTMLVPPGSEIHSYEPPAQDAIKIKECDIFIYVGGESDSWVDEILDSEINPELKVITLMDCTEVVEEVTVEGMEKIQDEENHGDDHSSEPEYDEHVWTSPRNAKLIVQKISDAICELDSENAVIYKENTSTYLSQLENLDIKFKQIADSSERKTVVFGDRFPFRYLADAYGLDYYAAFPGCSSQTEPSAATVRFLIDKVKSENIPAVFHIELGNEKMTGTICSETGAKKLLLHSCHNISRDEFTAGITYLELMHRNAEALSEALG